jgi:hypothetical protein
MLIFSIHEKYESKSQFGLNNLKVQICFYRGYASIINANTLLINVNLDKFYLGGKLIQC